MEDYKIVLDNLDKAIKDKIPDALKAAMEKACLIVEADAKKNCPVDDGQLRQSITHDVSTDNGTIEGTIGTNVEYAPYVEIGTGIYSAEGTGRKGGWLYEDEKSGELVFTMGQHPQPYLQPALDNNKEKIQQCFEGII